MLKQTFTQTFTVIGIYDDTGQVFCHEVNSYDAHEAMKLAAKYANEQGGDDYLFIACALPTPSAHTIVCACEDSGKGAYVEDLIREDDDADV